LLEVRSLSGFDAARSFDSLLRDDYIQFARLIVQHSYAALRIVPGTVKLAAIGSFLCDTALAGVVRDTAFAKTESEVGIL
jgi:hypothetical protein